MIMQSQTSSGEARKPGGLVRRLLWHHSLKPEVSNDGEDAADVAANDVLDDLDQAVNLEQDRAYKGKDEGPDNGHDNVEERNDGGKNACNKGNNSVLDNTKDLENTTEDAEDAIKNNGNRFNQGRNVDLNRYAVLSGSGGGLDSIDGVVEHFSEMSTHFASKCEIHLGSVNGHYAVVVRLDLRLLLDEESCHFLDGGTFGSGDGGGGI